MTPQPCEAAVCQAPRWARTGTGEAEEEQGLRFWKWTLLGLDPPSAPDQLCAWQHGPLHVE